MVRDSCKYCSHISQYAIGLIDLMLSKAKVLMLVLLSVVVPVARLYLVARAQVPSLPKQLSISGNVVFL